MKTLCEKCGESFPSWDTFKRHSCAMAALREIAKLAVPRPYTQKRNAAGIGYIKAWRCNFCSQVCLSVRKIKIHCAVEHGIRTIKI